MMEYLKRKFARLKPEDVGNITFPRYYEQNGKIIKELENGEKFEVALDSNYKEIVVEKL